MNRIIVCLAFAAFLSAPLAAFADHDKDCKSTHGTVTAKSDSSITVDGKSYTLDSNTPVTKHDGAATGAGALNVGDKVCLETVPGNERQVSKVMVMDKHARAVVRSDGVGARMSELDRKTHEKICKGNHGTITDKSANSLTIDGKQYAFKINTPVNKQGEPLLPKTSKVGDRVCFDTQKAADGSQQIAKLIAIDQDADRVRVRGAVGNSDTDVKVKNSPDKVEVETPEKKVEIK